MVDAQLADPFADRFDITRQSVGQPLDAAGDPGLGLTVPQRGEPVGELLILDDSSMPDCSPWATTTPAVSDDGPVGSERGEGLGGGHGDSSAANASRNCATPADNSTPMTGSAE